MKGWPTPPRGLVWLCAALLLAGTTLTILGAIRIGVTVDETFHVVRLGNFFEHGWYLLDDDLTENGPGGWVGDAYVYAPVTGLVLHALNVLLGNESWGAVATSADAYVVRHLGVVAIGLVGVACTAAMARLVSKSWAWGVVAAATLMCLPMWAGHAMFNVKDIPVATGYTMVTLGCMVFLRVGRPSVRGRVLAGSLIATGLLLTLGTRPGMWCTLGATLAWTLLVVSLRSRTRLSEAGWRWGDLLVVSLLPLAVLALIYPEVFQARPDRWLVGSVTGPGAQQMQSSRGHLPFAIATTVPLVLLFVALLGSFSRFMAWKRSPRWLDRTTPLMVLLLVQALLMPAAMVATTAAASGGLRHVLFAAPPVALLITAGLAQILADAPGALARRLVAGVAALGLLVPAAVQLQLFPYSYGYVNGFSDALGLPSTPDFWQASFREYVDVLEPGDFVVCGADLDEQDRPLRRMPNGGQSWLELSENCIGGGPLGVLAPYVREPSETVSPTFVALMVRNDPAPHGCMEIGRVTRARHLTTAVLSRALRCPLVLPTYSGAVRLDGAGVGAGYLLGGWTATGGDDSITVRDRASLGFNVAGGSVPSVVDVVGTAQEPVVFLVNNESVVARETDSGWRVSMPSVLPPLGAGGNVVLTVVASDGTARVSGFELG